jgi:hypothetical protein
MRVLTSEVDDLPLFERGGSDTQITDNIYDFMHEQDAVKKYGLQWDEYSECVVFSDVVTNIVFETKAVVFFHEYGIWPGAENLFLFDLVMKELLGQGVPYRAKSILFEKDEFNAARTVVQLGLESGWGGIIMSSRRSFFYFDHDRRGLIKSSKPVLELMKGFERTRVFGV